MSRSGADLALLLLGGFRSLVDTATAELARRGYEDVRPVHAFAMRAIAAGAGNAGEPRACYKDLRPVHAFAMRAIAAGAGNASDLGRRLSVSKQAAAKTI